MSDQGAEAQPAAGELEKTYDPGKHEAYWRDFWNDKRVFAASEHSDKPAYSVLLPPPNVTGMLHMGHMFGDTIQDIYCRWRRMAGDEVCWFPGVDHAGIATQSKVEQQLAKEGLSRHDLGREKFLERVWQWRRDYGDIILDQLRTIGVSCDWDRLLFTLDESASNAVTEVFIRLFDEGLIYRGQRIINWSPLAQTALSDEEVNFREVQDKLYTLRYHREDGGAPLLVATVRPETLFGDVAVAVNPADERYQDLIGSNVRVPLVGRWVPVIADDHARMDFGTGAVKITPAHDPNDFEVGKRHDLEMPNTINPDGTLNELTGEFNGVERYEARKRIVAKLEELELVEKIEDYAHSVGFSERGKEAVEPYLSDQWFVKMEPLAGDALQPVRDGEVRFHPEHWVKTYEHWMTNVRDWCISRQLWWGHRIPVYYTADGKFTAARSEEHARQKLELPAGTPLRQDPDVLDTWFSSALWPMTTMRWLADGEEEDNAIMQKFLPTDLLVTGPDIIFFWVARMIVMSKKFKQAIPFKDVYFTSLIRDGKGRKMSKSLGNSPDPLEIVRRYGADATRFSLIYVAPIGLDVRLAVDEKTQDISTIELGRNFANKIWNAARFLLMKRREVGADGSSAIDPHNQDLVDKWISARFNQTIVETRTALESFRLNEYSSKLYEFIWSDFCDWFVEAVKIRVAASGDAAQQRAYVDHAFGIFEGVLRLLHPVMPYLTEVLWHAIGAGAEDESLARAQFPVENPALIDAAVLGSFGRIQSVIEEVRTLRGQMKIPPHERLPVGLRCAGADDVALLQSVADLVRELTRAESLTISTDLSKPKGSIASLASGVEVFLTLAGHIDLDAERARINKEIKRMEGLVAGTSKKLGNTRFLDNAPPEVVENERDKLRNFESTLEKLKTNLAQLAE